MPGRNYNAIVTIGNVDIYQVSAAPFGSLTARAGSLAISSAAGGVQVYQNVDGATSWVLLSGNLFIFRPGDPTPGGNVYATTTALREALNNSSGPRVLALDNTFVAPSPITLDAGTYGDDQLTIQGMPFNTLFVEILEGALIACRQWIYPMNIIWRGTTPIHTFTAADSGVMILEKGARVARDATAGGPMWVVGPGATMSFAADLGGALTNDSGPLMHLEAGATVQCQPLDIGTLEPDTISGDVTASFFVFDTVISGGIYFPQPSFLGTLLISELPFPAYVTAGPFPLDNRTTGVTIDIAAPTTILLPPIDQVPSNFEIVLVKFDASGAVATIDGNGATINGALTTTLTAQYDSVTVQRHAVANFGAPEWIIIAERP